MAFATLLEAFILGLLTPLGAVCVLPLFPGFLAYLANKVSQGTENRKLFLYFGLIITLGVLVFMFLLGLIFTTVLQASLTNVIGIISPIAFGVLALISIFLIFDVDIGKYLPQTHVPVIENPRLNAFVYGFFFGAIVIPCNPLFIAALFTRTLVMTSFALNMLAFIMFGLGIAAPLLAFSVLSSAGSSVVISWLVRHRRTINVLAGLFMLAVSLYYLVFVFRILG